MKKLFLTAAIFCAMQGFAAVMPTTYIHGTTDAKGAKTMYLFRAADGNMEQFATVKANEAGSFAFAVAQPAEGFYYVSDNGNVNMLSHRIYMKGASTIEMDIKGGKAAVSGGSKENQLLSRWQAVYDDIAVPSWSGMQYRGTYEDFFPIFESFLPKYEAFRKNMKSGNKAFDELMQYLVVNDVDAAAINFLFMPRTKHPKEADYPAYYRQIVQPGKYAGTRALQLGDGVRRLGAYVMFSQMGKGGKATTEDMLGAIPNDTLKGMYLASSFGRYRSQDALADAMKPYKHLLVTDSLKARYQRAEAALATFAKGEKSFNFSYTDINGKTVSLASLKGKVVLVDMWATWCGPCKEQIPHLKKLEEEVKGTDIAIVSISVDKDADKQKWEDFVKERELGGIQLFAGSNRDMMDYYKISGIPRFLVFDKAGRIATVDAPRPSMPELKPLLMQLAGEK
ncbi:TlpA disulfide reductase family protein [Chitinophaga pollutisoli]|uniref:TlpA disulfide reductase family protein n=1 Tax=Chitinophaga pollutisoli TaxID=3133966 RepID=A0ABZ2YLZ9_9BACT